MDESMGVQEIRDIPGTADPAILPRNAGLKMNQ